MVVTNRAGSVTSEAAALLLDSDGDGLPDAWENANFPDPDPSHPLSGVNQRSDTDPDRDGVSNVHEFLEGTNPNDNVSLRPRLTLYSSGDGSVTASPMKLSYDFGEVVTLTPSAPPDVFVGWAGDLGGADNPATLTMDRNKSVRARFASPVPLLPGLIALWRGESDASDLIGEHHGSFFVGTVATGPRVTASGKVGGALDFDGTVHVVIPDAPALKPAQFTVETWVFPTVSKFDRQTIIAHGSSKDDSDTWILDLINGFPVFVSHGNRQLECPFSIPLNDWTHLAITFDGAIKRLFVNGMLVAARDESGDPLIYDAVPVTIGADLAGNVSGARFNGRIDEIALYHRALDAVDVAAIYNADRVGKSVSPPYFTSPSRLPAVALGASYAEPLTTVLGTPPVGFSMSAGGLPPGIVVSGNGIVQGVPVVPGVFGFTARATDAVGNFTDQRCVVRVLSPVRPPAGLIAAWRGDGDARDLIGGHQGTFFTGAVVAAPGLSPSGKVGGAFDFDGTRHVRVVDSAALKPARLTVEAWVFPRPPSAGFHAIVARGSTSDDRDAWYLGLLDGRPQFWSHGDHLLEGPSTIPLNDWTHLTVTFDGVTKRLYVNGVQVGSRHEFALVYDAASAPVTIGSDFAFNAPAALFSGLIDEVAIYNRALTTAEVAAVHDSDFVGKDFGRPYFTSPAQLPDAALGVAYLQPVTTILGTPPTAFAIASGALPPGLTMSAAGALGGIATATGTFEFTVAATDGAGARSEQACTLDVS